LQEAGRHLSWRTNSTQQNSVVFTQRLQVFVGQQLTVVEVACRAQIEISSLNIITHSAQNLNCFCCDLWADAVSANNRESHCVVRPAYGVELSPFVTGSG